jgi:multidrug efflux pump subunit AcrA (membrane-fusion protein)
VEYVKDALSIPVDAVQRGNVVLVPEEGAFDKNGQLIDTGKLREVTVTLGRNDTDYIEVLSGLNEGDTVVIANQASSLMDQMTQREDRQESRSTGQSDAGNTSGGENSGGSSTQTGSKP